jgi:hypothetical protein
LEPIFFGIGILVMSLPFFVSRRWRVLIRRAAKMMNRPGSGVLRAVNVIELFLLLLGLSCIVGYWVTPDSAGITLANVVFDVLALAVVASMATVLSQVWFNFPRIFAPRELRGESGAVVEVFRQLTGRKPPTRKSRDAATTQWDAAWGGGVTVMGPQPKLAVGEVVITQRLANWRQSEFRWVGGKLVVTGSRIFFTAGLIDVAFAGQGWELAGESIRSAERFKSSENMFRDVLKITGTDGSVNLLLVNKLDRMVTTIRDTFTHDGVSAP